jgi:hypothetical protein
MKDFIVTSKGAVNVAHVSFAAFQPDGGIALHVGSNVLTFDAGSEDAKTLNSHFERPEPAAPEEAEGDNARTPKKRR